VSRLVLRHVDHLATFDDAGTEHADCDLVAVDGVITAVGPGVADDLAPLPGDRVVDGRGLVVLPGLVNAHQHLYQGAFRAVPELERIEILPWLAGLGSRVRAQHAAGRFGPDAVEAVAAAVLTESLLGGQTTVADQHYFHPAGPTQPYVEATIGAAGALGVRLTAARGTLTLGPEPSVLQDVDEVVRHCEELIATHHDPSPAAMVRVALAPCGVHADRPELFDELAALAADHPGVRLHTHLYEVVDTDACRELYGTSPWEFLVEHGWAGPQTWLAHVCDVPVAELPQMAAAGVSVAHLVAPDLRMGWGLAPLRAMLDAELTVGFGTTGSSSNDGANLLGDLRLAALAHRSTDADPLRWPSARELLGAATRGSALCLGRPELGRLEVGAQCDLAGWDMDAVDRVGVHDPVAGLVLTGLGSRADLVAVGGEVLIEDGDPVAFDPDEIAARAREALAP
jgi:cytosine/adenosine deaminase-related metal-dependent hydrolase